MVELAMSIFVLLAITFGITEFGRAIYEYNTLAKAARDATRYLSMRDTLEPATRNQAICLVVHGNPSCSGAPLLAGLTASMVSICDPVACAADHAAQGSAPVVNLVTITIGGPKAAPYTFTSVASFIVPDIVFGPISVTMKQVL